MRVRHVFFFKDTATTEIYTLSLHDALPIWRRRSTRATARRGRGSGPSRRARWRSAAWTTSGWPRARRTCTTWGSAFSPCSPVRDRKSTRLNSSHANISYAVFCLKKKIMLIEPTLHSDSSDLPSSIPSYFFSSVLSLLYCHSLLPFFCLISLIPHTQS